MSHEIDARGLACPQPVIKTKKMLEQLPDGNFTILVDNENSRDNVMRMLANRGYKTASNKEGNDYRILVGQPVDRETAQKELDAAEISCSLTEPSGNLVVYLKSSQMGYGAEKLGNLLIRGFLQTLKDLSPLPSSIICVNSGVFLSTENKDTVTALKELEDKGVTILSCGTCLDFYQLKDKLAVGKVSNMYEIAETLCNAAKTVSP